MNNVDKQIEKLQQELNELKQQRELEQQQAKARQWEPLGGHHYIRADGKCGYSESTESYRNFGVERPTEALVFKAASIMRQHNRLLAYVHEHAPEWDHEDDSEEAYAVYWGDDKYKDVHCDGMQDLGTVTMPKWVARKLAEDLNSGRVKL